jgi:tetratricopeptide (TPR) repeat protein
VDPIAHPSEWSRYYYDKATRYIRRDPSGYAALLFKKLMLYWNGHEIERNMSFSHAATLSPIMAFPLVSFRWIAPLALVGLILALRRRAGLGLPVLLLLSQMAAVVAFFVCARYRMAAVPVLIILASYASVTIIGELHRKWKEALPVLLLIAAAVVVVNVDWYGIAHKSYARDDYELALVVRRDGRLDESLRLLTVERSARPDDPDVPFQMGVTLLRLKENGRAAEAFAAAAALEPKYALTWFNLGISHMRSGDSQAAVEAYEKALEVNPAYWEAAQAVGRVREESGAYDEAAEAYLRSLALARNREERGVVLVALGIVYARTGEYDLSLKQFDEAIAANADLVSAYLNKARVLKAMGRDEEAIRQVEFASRLAPSDERVKSLLDELRR